MADGFVPLAAVLRGDDPEPRVATGVTTEVPLEMPRDDEADARTTPEAGLFGELARLRLATHDAFERATVRMLGELAHDVLARELALRPVDVGALVARAVAAYTEHDVLEIAVCSADAIAVAGRTTVAVRVDDALAPGDLVVRVRDGAFESSFAFRVAHVLSRAPER